VPLKCRYPHTTLHGITTQEGYNLNITLMYNSLPSFIKNHIYSNTCKNHNLYLQWLYLQSLCAMNLYFFLDLNP
jgi:hypothetical protein